jgi:prolipoprotein diacylglyceryltransferase
MSGNIIELINETAISNINKLIWYSLTVTVVAIIAITKTQKEFMRYKMWKKDTIKILGFTREWEATPDSMLQQLWDENQRLEA